MTRLTAIVPTNAATNDHQATQRYEMACSRPGMNRTECIATAVPTPTIDRLYPQLDPEAPLMPEGSAEIPLEWRGVWIGLGALAWLLMALAVVARLLRGRRGCRNGRGLDYT